MIDAAREHQAATAQHHDAHAAIAADFVERGAQLLHRGRIESVALVGSVEPQSCDRSGTFEQDACHAGSLGKTDRVM